jgi:nucleoredoxin
MSLSALIGETLVSPQSEDVPTSSLSGKTIGIYFGANWCGPCHKFLPALTEFREKFSAEKNFEFVYCSLDRSGSDFAKYHSSMPFPAIPFHEDELRDSLSNKFEVKGIPTLVIVDSNGELITTRGREKLLVSPESFPWNAKSFYEIIGEGPLNAAGDKISVDTLKQNDVVGVYFSGSWCAPCQKFTPQLIETYKTLKQAADKKFEVIFVSK